VVGNFACVACVVNDGYVEEMVTFVSVDNHCPFPAFTGRVNGVYEGNSRKMANKMGKIA